MFKIKDGNSWTELPEPARGGISVTDEPIWAANTGRNTKGKMIGDIVAWKTTIEVTWPPLTYAQARSIRNAIRGAGEFFKIKYSDIEWGADATPGEDDEKTVYAANIPRTLYSLSPKYRRYDGITIQFIEQ